MDKLGRLHNKTGQDRCLRKASKYNFGSCDCNLQSPKSRTFHALARWTTCTSLHQNWFGHFQNITFTSLVTDKRTERDTRTGRKRYASCHSSRAEALKQDVAVQALQEETKTTDIFDQFTVKDSLTSLLQEETRLYTYDQLAFCTVCQ